MGVDNHKPYSKTLNFKSTKPAFCIFHVLFSQTLNNIPFTLLSLFSLTIGATSIESDFNTHNAFLLFKLSKKTLTKLHENIQSFKLFWQNMESHLQFYTTLRQFINTLPCSQFGRTFQNPYEFSSSFSVGRGSNTTNDLFPLFSFIREMLATVIYFL